MNRIVKFVRSLAWVAVFVAAACPGAYAQQGGVGAASIVTIDSKSYYVHTVAAGETVYSLARSYGVSQDDIMSSNPLAVGGIKQGQTLKIPVPAAASENLSRAAQRRESRKFDTHTVNAGETAYAITRRYGISVGTLIEDNPGLDPAKLSPGQELRIRKSAQDEASDSQLKEQWAEYTDAVNSVSDEYHYHLVQPGETVYSISRQLGVPQNLIMRNNDLPNGVLKAGVMIKVPADQLPGAEVEDVEDVVQPAEPTAVEDKFVALRDVSGKGVYNVAMLLPLKVEGSYNRNQLEFYQGALLAIEDLKDEGIGVRLDLYNVGRAEADVREALDDPDFANADLVIGPVYEDNMMPVAVFAADKKIPLVSPLSALNGNYGSFVYQMSPSASTKYDKLKELLSPEQNIVIITTGKDDPEFAREVQGFLPSGCRRVAYTGSTRAIEELVSRERENVFVILSNDEHTVDRVLASISSIQTNLLSRSMKIGPIRVIGSPRWTRFSDNIDKALYFKLRLTFVTSYHAGREAEPVARFDSRYVANFGVLPSQQYSYRGYDAMRMFVEAMSGRGGDLNSRLNAMGGRLLQTPYRFVRNGHGGNNVNDQWVLVTYNTDYTVEVR